MLSRFRSPLVHKAVALSSIVVALPLALFVAALSRKNASNVMACLEFCLVTYGVCSVCGYIFILVWKRNSSWWHVAYLMLCPIPAGGLIVFLSSLFDPASASRSWDSLLASTGVATFTLLSVGWMFVYPLVAISGAILHRTASKVADDSRAGWR
jgi:hypothetical protein